MINKSKTLQFSVKALVTLSAFWLVLHGIDFGQWHGMLEQQDWSWMIAVIAIVILQVTLGALRWKIILKIISPDGHADMSWLRAAKIVYITAFFNTCLPGSIGGDVIRVWLTKSDRLPLTIAVHSTIIDRLVGLAGVCCLITTALIPLGHMAGFNAVPLVLAILAAGVAGLFLLFRISAIMEKWKHRHFIAWLVYLAENFLLLIRRPGAFLVSLAISFIGHVLFCLMSYVLAKSLGVQLSLTDCLILIPPVPLAAALPISIGGWGIREGGMVAMLALAHVPQSAALMLSIQVGIVGIVTTLPGGILWLAQRNTKEKA
jgi:uncharacterized protein (TIRG00374 family)